MTIKSKRMAHRRMNRMNDPRRLYSPYSIPYLETCERNDWCWNRGYMYDPTYGIKVVRPRKTSNREMLAVTVFISFLLVSFLLFCTCIGAEGGKLLSKTAVGKTITTSAQATDEMDRPWDVDATADASHPVPATTDKGYKVSGASEYSRFIAYSLYNHEYRLDVTDYANKQNAPSVQDVIDDAIHQNPLLLISDCDYKYGTYSGRTSIEISPVGMVGGEKEVDEYRATLDRRANYLIYKYVDTNASVNKIAYQIDCALTFECEYDDDASDYANLVNSGKKTIRDYVNAYPFAWNAYGALYDGNALCEGYANGYKLLCDKAGIECVAVSGTYDDGPHAWDLVHGTDGAWYMVDPTFDDYGDQCNGAYCMTNVSEIDKSKKNGKTRRFYNEDYTLDGELSEMGFPDWLIED